VVLAAYSSYSSCRQYREDVERARATAGPSAPRVDKLRVFYNHPEFIAANSDRVRAAIGSFGADRRDSVSVAFTAHSIPASMSRNCDYEKQLRETCRLIAEDVGIGDGRWSLVYQSRSGRPGDPWLEPDILDHLKELQSAGVKDVMIHPVGFLSDHMEVMYDLDEEASQVCDTLGLTMVRSRTVGTHPRFVGMLRELIAERIDVSRSLSPRAIGLYRPNHDVCPETCCLPSVRPTNRPVA
jgi:protoporphyrin/coproporphyrin ferrochelatase